WNDGRRGGRLGLGLLGRLRDPRGLLRLFDLGCLGRARFRVAGRLDAPAVAARRRASAPVPVILLPHDRSSTSVAPGGPRSVCRLDGGRQAVVVGRDAAGSEPPAWGRRRGGYEGDASRSPMMPATMSAMHANRNALAGSSKRMMPRMAVPVVPIPVQTA